MLNQKVVRSSAVGIGSTCARVSGTLTPLIFLLVWNNFLYCDYLVLKKKIINRDFMYLYGFLYFIWFRNYYFSLTLKGFTWCQVTFGAVRYSGAHSGLLLGIRSHILLLWFPFRLQFFICYLAPMWRNFWNRNVLTPWKKTANASAVFTGDKGQPAIAHTQGRRGVWSRWYLLQSTLWLQKTGW